MSERPDPAVEPWWLQPDPKPSPDAFKWYAGTEHPAPNEGGDDERGTS